MPANLPPTYHAAEQRFRSAKTNEDKIAALEEMLRIMPKHKGTDKLQGDLKARLAKLRRQPARKGARQTHSHLIPREGAGQIALVGPPNAGKSSLVKRLTHAEPEVAEYPFTTREPVPGMMPFEDIAFQLIDLPPVCREHMEPWLFDLIRRADLCWIVVDEAGSLDGLDLVRGLLEPKRIGLHPAGALPREPRGPGWLHKPSLVVISGMDRQGASGDLEALRELLEEPWPLVPVSSVTGAGLDDLGRRTYESLEIFRVYTKEPGKEVDRERPFTLERGATVGELARLIHKDLEQNLRFARIWGSSAFDGQTVHRDHVLEEGDVVEIHA